MKDDDKKTFKLLTALVIFGIICNFAVRYIFNTLPKDNIKIQRVINEAMPMADFLLILFIAFGLFTILLFVITYLNDRKEKTNKNSGG